MHCNIESEHSAVRFLGSARAPRADGGALAAMNFIPRQETDFPPGKASLEKVRDDEGACAPRTAANIPFICTRFICYTALALLRPRLNRGVQLLRATVLVSLASPGEPTKTHNCTQTAFVSV